MAFDWKVFFFREVGVANLITLVLRTIVHCIIALCNPFDTYGPNYASVSLLTGRLSTGAIEVADLLLDPDLGHINHLSLRAVVSFNVFARALSIEVIVDDLDAEGKLEPSWDPAASATATPPSAPSTPSADSSGRFSVNNLLIIAYGCLRKVSLKVSRCRIAVNEDLLLQAADLSASVDMALWEYHLEADKLQIISTTDVAEDIAAVSGLSFQQINNASQDAIALSVEAIHCNLDHCLQPILRNYMVLLISLNSHSVEDIKSSAARRQAALLQAISGLQAEQRDLSYDEEDHLCCFPAVERHNLAHLQPGDGNVLDDGSEAGDEHKAWSLSVRCTLLTVLLSCVDNVEEVLHVSNALFSAAESMSHEKEGSLSVAAMQIVYSDSGLPAAVANPDIPLISMQYKACSNSPDEVLTSMEGGVQPLHLVVSVQAIRNALSAVSTVSYYLDELSKIDKLDNIDMTIAYHRENAQHTSKHRVHGYDSVHVLLDQVRLDLHCNQHLALRSSQPTTQSKVLSCEFGQLQIENVGTTTLGVRLASCQVTNLGSTVDYSRYDLQQEIGGSILKLDDLMIHTDDGNHNTSTVITIESIAGHVNQFDLILLGLLTRLLSEEDDKDLPALTGAPMAWKLIDIDTSFTSNLSLGVGKCKVNAIYVNPAGVLERAQSTIKNDVVIYNLLDSENICLQRRSVGNCISETTLAVSKVHQMTTSRHCLRGAHVPAADVDDEINLGNNNDNNHKILCKLVPTKEDQERFHFATALGAPAKAASLASSIISGSSGENVITLTTRNVLAEHHSINSLGVGYHCSSTVLNIANPTILFDYQDIHEALILVNIFQHCSETKPHYKKSIERPKPVEHVLRNPTSVFTVNINKMRVTCEHFYRPTLYISTNRISLSTVNFADYCFQLNASVSNLIVNDLSADYVIHKEVVSSVDANNGILSNISMHYTSIEQDADQITPCNGLFEVNVEHLRVVYLHRSLFTILCYFMDFLIPDVEKTLDSREYAGEHCLEIPPPVPVDPLPLFRGMFRLCVAIKYSELHLPTNSCAMEGLTIIFKQLNLYRSNDYHENNYALKKYLQGPLIVKQLWLSEAQNISTYHERAANHAEKIFAGQGNVMSERYENINNVHLVSHAGDLSSIDWLLVANQKELIHHNLPVYTRCQSYLWIDLHDATLCTWCNNNVLAEHQDLSIKFYMYKVTPYDESRCTNPDVTANIADQQETGNHRNTMVVYIAASGVNWILSQGQYWAIVNLIQQNFNEIQEHVIDPYVPPKFKNVKLKEECYGVYAMDKILPIINSVPIQVNKGKITFIFNESSFYERFLLPAPRAPLFSLYQAHDIHYEMPDTLPSVDHVIFIRNNCYQGWNACPSVCGADANSSFGSSYNAMYNTIYNLHREEAESSPICLVFEDLYVDFYRKHFGGGTGIEVYASSFIVVGMDDDAYDNYDPANADGKSIHNIHSLFEEIDIKNVVFAPKSCPLLQTNKEAAATGNVYADAQEVITSAEPVVQEPAEQVLPGVDMNDYMSVHMYSPVYPDMDEINATYNAHLNMPRSLCDTKYGIHEPVYNNSRYYTAVPHIRYSQQSMGNLRRCAVSASESVVIAHFQIIMSIVKYFNHPCRITNNRNDHVVRENHKKDLDYKEELDVEVHLENTLVFIPNFQSTYLTNSANDSKTAAGLTVLQYHDCTGLGINLNVKYTHAWRGFLLSGPGSARSTISATLLNMFIAPLYECNIIDIISLLDILTIEFSLIYRVHPTEEMYYTNHNLLLNQVTFDDWVSKMNKLDRPSGNRIMRLTMKNLHNSNINEEKDSFLNPSTDTSGNLRSTFSIKDIEFLLSAVNKLRQSIQKQILKTPKKDPFHSISKFITDIRHIPDNTFFCLSTDLSQGLHTDTKEFDSEIHNFDIVIHNNTYNLNILNIVVSEICMTYTRSLDHLHMVAGVYLSMSSFNDTLDSWEPIVEPVHIRAIGATDATGAAAGAASGAPGSANVGLLNASKIRVEVSADRVELNASQSTITNIIYKLQLNDVVTTSSNRLPPYKIINQLGINIFFNIGFNGGIVINNVINTNSALPIEINQLTSALNTYKMRKLYNTALASTGSMNSQHNREYLLWISFLNFRDVYESHTPLSIDKVGTTAFEMIKTTRKPGQNPNQQFSTFPVAEADGADSNSPIKFVAEVPLTLMQMQIQANGIRELYIRSILSIHNNTTRTMHISVKLYGSSIETSLLPNKVYHVPVRFANPKASLLFKFPNGEEDGPYFEAMHCMSAFISQGSWGNPQKLRSHLCLCPSEGSNPSMNWLVMLKPEVRQINSLTAGSNKQNIQIKYPTKETYMNKVAPIGRDAGSISNNINVTTTTAMNAPIKVISSNFSNIKPLCVHIQAPLLLCNVLPQPLLYKLADDNNIVCAEGLLLPGQVIDVYNLSSMFNSKIFVTVRLCNYAWSKWYVLCSRTTPYNTTEKTIDITLQPLSFKAMSMSNIYNNTHSSINGGVSMNLPTLDITIIEKEYLIRFTCQLILNNITNLPLFAAENSHTERFVILNSSNKSTVKASTSSVRLHRPNSTSYNLNELVPQVNTFTAAPAIEEEEDTSESSEYTTNTNTGNAASTVNTSSNTSNVLTLSIYMPWDHLKKISTHIHGESTLEDVFNHIKPQVSHVHQFADFNDYLFFLHVPNKQSLNILADISTEGEADETSSNAGTTTGSVESAVPSAPVKGGLFRARSLKSVETKSPDAVLPLSMRYMMSVDFNEPLSMYSPVHMLTSFDLVLIHKAEYTIFTQSKQMTVETTVDHLNTSIFNTVFGKSKSYSYLANYVNVEGSIPYKPHRMLSFHSHIAVKDMYNTEWSNSVDVVKTDFDVGDMVINIKSKFHNYNLASATHLGGTHHVVNYELGAYIERGSGLLQHTTFVTFVPKRILVSKLNFNVHIRQIVDSSNLLEIADTELVAGGNVDYYFVNKQKTPLLQVRKVGGGKRDTDRDSMVSMSSSITVGEWYGELDICHLGIVYVKLRNPLVIIRVETEVIGASYISTFTEQTLIWPPYKVLNSTNMMMRFKQFVDDQDVMEDIPYDMLKPKQSVAFAWDLPQTVASKVIRLEVQNNNNNFTSKDINLYALYNNNQSDHIIIKKFIPNIGNPLAEGFLFTHNQATDSYSKVYCILRPDTLYIYEDESRNILINIINLSYMSDTGVKFAVVTKINDSKNNLFTNFFNNNKNKNNTYDINNVRFIMMTIANYLHLFSHLSVAMFTKANRSNSEDSVDHERKASVYTDLSTVQSPAEPALVSSTTSVTHLFNSIVEKVPSSTTLTSEDNRADSLEGTMTAATIINEIFAVGAPRSSRTSPTTEIVPDPAQQRPIGYPEEDLPVVVLREPGADGLLSTLAASAIATPPPQPLNLHALLDGGVSIEQLMEELANTPVHLGDIVSAMVECHIVENEEQAALLCEYFIAEGFLVKKNVKSNRLSIYGFDPYFDEDNEDNEGDPDRETIISNDVEGDLPSVPGSPGRVPAPVPVPVPASSTDLPAQSGEADDFQTYRKDMTKALTEAIRKRYAAATKTEKAVIANKSVLEGYVKEDLLFNPPSLCPELAAAMEQSIPGDRRSIYNPTPANDEQFGFSINVGNAKYHFRCGSEMEYLGWLQSCRTSVELAWKEIELGKKTVSTQSVEDFQISLTVKVKADGSTKVLEVLEADPTSGANKKMAEIRGNKKGVASDLKRRSAAILMPLLNRSRRLLNQVGSTEAEVEDWSSDLIDRDQELLAVSFAVKSVSLSVIDAAPAEILYIGFNDISMGVVRYFDAVQFSVTVRNIQVSNQLLNPTFPVMLFARRIKEGQAGRLMLPGLDADRYANTQSYPTLHLYLQQRYHNINPETGMAKADEGHQRLWYFDIFTLWLAPLQLAIDEEILVRLMRYGWNIRTALVTDANGHKGKLVKDDVVIGLQSSRFMQTQLEHKEVFDYFTSYMDSAKITYNAHHNNVKAALNIYFSLLQLHPVDITLNFRPSPEVQLTNAELAMISIVSQLDSARLCLNALLAENAFGSTTIISEIIVKHYRAAFWRQFHRLIGASDLVEGSVGLVANIGTGFYDMFYEPIDGLLDENKSFLNGLSKGGMSLASRAIGGTSGFASTLSGGIGKGVSLLTLDTEFQKTRSLRRYNKTSTVSEGLLVGTQELGKNIMEGVAGIVVAPIKGWETGGGVGFGVGIAKGILGVALKPAVGVLDLASRATEGIRNSAFNTVDITVEMQGTYRTRIPRAFGRSGLLVVYDAHSAAAQYMVDSLTGFRLDPRFLTISHLYLVRKLTEDQRYHNFMFKIESIKRRDSNFGMVASAKEEIEDLQEAWGMGINRQYLVVVGPERVALLEVLDPDLSPPTAANTPKKKAPPQHRRFVWSCPATCIDQLCCDNRGDLVLTLSSAVHISGQWNNTQPAVLEANAQNYVIMQSLLEQTIGLRQARMQPLIPWTGLTQKNIRKRYQSGIRSYLLAPSFHTYRLFGSVIYEYTPISKKPQKAERSVSEEGEQAPAVRSEIVLNSAEYAEKLIRKLFDPTQALRRDAESRRRRRQLLLEIREKQQKAEEADETVEPVEESKERNDTDLMDEMTQEMAQEVLDEGVDELIAENPSGHDSGRFGLETITEAMEEEEGDEEPPLASATAASQDLTDRIEAAESSDPVEILEIAVRNSEGSAPEQSVSMANIRRNSLDSDDEMGVVDVDEDEDEDDDSESSDSGMRASELFSASHIVAETDAMRQTMQGEEVVNDEVGDDMFLSFVYPLVDLSMTGPNVEDNGKAFSITLTRIDGQKMRVLRREDDNDHFSEYKKNSLSLLFHTMEQAMHWRHAIEGRIILRAPDPLPDGPLTTEDKRKAQRTVIAMASNRPVVDSNVPVEGSILSSLVLPTSDTDPELAEMIKIEIARTISNAKR